MTMNRRTCRLTPFSTGGEGEKNKNRYSLSYGEGGASAPGEVIILRGASAAGKAIGSQGRDALQGVRVSPLVGVRFVLLLLLLLTAVFTVRAQDDPFPLPPPANCDGTRLCVPLFDTRMRIDELKALLNVPVFAAPLLELRFTLQNIQEADRGLPLTVYIDQYALIGNVDSTNPTHCELIVVGLATGSDEYTDSLEFEPFATTPTHTVKLHAYCKDINLPRVIARNLPFPTQDQPMTTTNIEALTDQAAAMKTLVDRARQPGATLGIRNLETQFAVWVLYGATWQQFQVEAENSLFKRQMAAIYALLDPFPTPVPTATFTPMPTDLPPGTSTAVPTQSEFLNEQISVALPSGDPPLMLSVGQMIGLAALSLLGVVITVGIVRASPRLGVVLIAVVILAVFLLIRQLTS